jgi:hypothetical protein
MREASDILNTPAAMQIRYLETLKQMAHESGSKIIFMPPNFDMNSAHGAISGASSGKGKGGMSNVEKLVSTQMIADL